MSDDAPYLAPYGRHIFICTGEYSDHCDPEQRARRFPDGVWYHHVDEALIDRIVEEHLAGGQPVASHVFHAQSDHPQPG